MPKPLDPDKRAAIEQSIRDGAGQRSTGAIAKEHGVSRTSVHRIAKAAGLEGSWERSQTQNATQARTADLAELRSQTSARLLRKANELLDRIDEPCEVFSFGGVANDFTSHMLDRPPSGDVRNFMTSAAIALDKHIAIEKHDVQDESSGAAVDSWLRHLFGGGPS